MTTRSHVVSIPCSGIQLAGELAVPDLPQGLVVFAHGSGSSRASPRNRFVAEALQQRGFATLLFDLLTVDEERIDEVDTTMRFDVDFLGERLIAVTDWLRPQRLPFVANMGYFGASTGAAAALIAAARRPEIRAVVSRGGRPDLAGNVLEQVRAPTLLIVGGRDYGVIELNQAAARRLPNATLQLVPGATHLFEEPGALARAAALAGDWFGHFLTTTTQEARP
jgi:pimeloyl-ACP methyl ester carboxylesterase